MNGDGEAVYLGGPSEAAFRRHYVATQTSIAGHTNLCLDSRCKWVQKQEGQLEHGRAPGERLRLPAHDAIECNDKKKPARDELSLDKNAKQKKKKPHQIIKKRKKVKLKNFGK